MNTWDALHQQERFRPKYPLDHIVRQVLTQFPRDREKRKEMKILDLGCGAGRHVVFLAQEGFQAYGTDLSKEGLKHTQERLESEGLYGTIQQAVINNQPYPNNYFDGILCVGVIYYNAVSYTHLTLPTNREV